jgi:hypothetical protein
MKKEFIAIVSISLLVVVSSASPAASRPRRGGRTDAQLIFNGQTLDSTQEALVKGIATDMEIDAQTLLNNPDQMNIFGEGDDKTVRKDGWGIYTKNGCSVNSACALQAIGLGLSLQCLPAAYDPESWANCVKSKNDDAYYDALQCTWQDTDPNQTCDFLGSVEGENTYACNIADPAAALGRGSVEMPAGLDGGQSRVSSIDLLSQG